MFWLAAAFGILSIVSVLMIPSAAIDDDEARGLHPDREDDGKVGGIAVLLDPAAAKPWFLTIVRREYARSFERKRFVTVDVDELIAAEEPLLAASEDEELMELRAALFRLPDDYREPLVLQVLMGYSTAEIAAELGLSNAAVLTRLFRARKQLRALCGEDTRLDPEE